MEYITAYTLDLILFVFLLRILELMECRQGHLIPPQPAHLLVPLGLDMLFIAFLFFFLFTANTASSDFLALLFSSVLPPESISCSVATP